MRTFFTRLTFFVLLFAFLLPFGFLLLFAPGVGFGQTLLHSETPNPYVKIQIGNLDKARAP